MYTILLVDDEKIVREAFKVILDELEGVRSAGEAAFGKEALRLLESSNPDMTFLDIKIPGMNILDLIKQMKRLNSNNKIILLSDHGSSEFVFKALEMGADGYLLKPYLQKDIMNLVNLYLPQVSSPKVNLEQTMEQFIRYVIKEDRRNATEQLKILTQYLLAESNLEVVRNTAESLVKGLEVICLEKGILFSKKHDWVERLDNMEHQNFESVIFSILDDIFAKMKDSQSIQDIKLIQSVINYIEKNYQKGVTLEEAAEHVHLSPFYLSKLFKKELNINFVNYVTERKIDKAKELLETTDLPILNIALELNYQEPNYFSKVFKKVVGITPTEYRKDKQNFPSPLFKKSNQILNGKWYI